MVPKGFISEVFWLKQIGSLFGSEGLLLGRSYLILDQLQQGPIGIEATSGPKQRIDLQG